MAPLELFSRRTREKMARMTDAQSTRDELAPEKRAPQAAKGLCSRSSAGAAGDKHERFTDRMPPSAIEPSINNVAPPSPPTAPLPGLVVPHQAHADDSSRHKGSPKERQKGREREVYRLAMQDSYDRISSSAQNLHNQENRAVDESKRTRETPPKRDRTGDWERPREAKAQRRMLDCNELETAGEPRRWSSFHREMREKEHRGEPRQERHATSWCKEAPRCHGRDYSAMKFAESVASSPRQRLPRDSRDSDRPSRQRNQDRSCRVRSRSREGGRGESPRTLVRSWKRSEECMESNRSGRRETRDERWERCGAYGYGGHGQAREARAWSSTRSSKSAWPLGHRESHKERRCEPEDEKSADAGCRPRNYHNDHRPSWREEQEDKSAGRGRQQELVRDDRHRGSRVGARQDAQVAAARLHDEHTSLHGGDAHPENGSFGSLCRVSPTVSRAQDSAPSVSGRSSRWADIEETLQVAQRTPRNLHALTMPCRTETDNGRCESQSFSAACASNRRTSALQERGSEEKSWLDLSLPFAPSQAFQRLMAKHGRQPTSRHDAVPPPRTPSPEPEASDENVLSRYGISSISSVETAPGLEKLGTMQRARNCDKTVGADVVVISDDDDDDAEDLPPEEKMRSPHDQDVGAFSHSYAQEQDVFSAKQSNALDSDLGATFNDSCRGSIRLGGGQIGGWRIGSHVDTEGGELFVVEAVVGQRKRRAGRCVRTELLVLWHGYGLEHATWELSTNIPPIFLRQFRAGFLPNPDIFDV